ncbi:M28 family peptidase [Aquimarina sp. RZ0]|uniref:M28 family peptidase n=1 Tax=Aquimarina sp. RZ0 TaxID=2607730 RepID=UPI002107BE4F|nr:M28 family peptidase [Aquimarina sp. RZ0]
MIGRNINNELYAVGGRYTEKIKRILDNFKNKTTVRLLQGHDGSDGKQNWTLASDHAPFHIQKLPFIYFGEEDHPDYHKETDDFQNILPEFYKNSVELIIRVFKDIDDSWNKK